MPKKKPLDLSDLDRFVFSTDESYEQTPQITDQTSSPKTQVLEAHFSNKGRGGKTVTVIKGFVGNEEELKNLGKRLKTKCGVGGSIKNGEILIQGNHRDKIIEILKKEGHRVKRVGG